MPSRMNERRLNLFFGHPAGRSLRTSSDALEGVEEGPLATRPPLSGTPTWTSIGMDGENCNAKNGASITLRIAPSRIEKRSGRDAKRSRPLEAAGFGQSIERGA